MIHPTLYVPRFMRGIQWYTRTILAGCREQVAARRLAGKRAEIWSKSQRILLRIK